MEAEYDSIDYLIEKLEIENWKEELFDIKK